MKTTLFNPVLNQSFDITINEEWTNIWGLKFKPQMEEYDNDDEYAPFLSCTLPYEVSPNNFRKAKEISKNHMTHGIIEIGVNRNREESITQAILSEKPDHIPYLGIDLDDKSYLNDVQKNIFTIKENSFNQEIIREYLNKIGVDKISILMIDGDHSVNACINDWMYTDLLVEGGVVIFHDTNYHPGPYVFLKSIDENKYRVEKYFEGELDYGLGAAYKLHNKN